jgi:hypothetical protein
MGWGVGEGGREGWRFLYWNSEKQSMLDALFPLFSIYWSSNKQNKLTSLSLSLSLSLSGFYEGYGRGRQRGRLNPIWECYGFW